MIVDNAVYRRDSRVLHDLDVADVDGVRGLKRPGDYQWVSLHEPTRDELDLVARTFGLHPLVVENALHAHQRPKVERHDDMLLVVLKTLWYVAERDAVETGEVSLFVGPDYAVTVRHGGGADLSATGELDHRARARAHGPAAVLYAVCDRVVDDYDEVVQALEVDIDEVEGSVFSDSRSDDSARIYVLKREVAEVRRAAFPLREPLRRLVAGQAVGQLSLGTQDLLDAETARYLRDVSEHLHRVCETLDGLDSLLSAAFDGHVARISLQQNDDMRKISTGAALIVVPTLIAGIYGMNFDHMPELGWVWGYPFALLLMVGVSAGLYAWFKRSGWW